MYVSYLLDKDVSMYPSSVRHSGSLNLAPQNFVSPPQYPDYGGYHVAAAAAAAANLDSAQSPGPSWPAAYGAPLREDWNGYAPGGAAAAANAVAHGLNGGSPAAAMGYSGPADYHPHHHPHHHAHHPAAAPSCASGLLQTLNPGPPGPVATAAAEQLSPGGQRRNLCEWMRKPAQPALGSQGKGEAPFFPPPFLRKVGSSDPRETPANVAQRGCSAVIASTRLAAARPRSVRGCRAAPQGRL
ncbi:hypothetical protein K5549_005298 [Capra hircus]|nr:hypothetical protein K5549_005298 [Capra hircus]